MVPGQHQQLSAAGLEWYRSSVLHLTKQVHHACRGDELPRGEIDGSESVESDSRVLGLDGLLGWFNGPGHSTPYELMPSRGFFSWWCLGQDRVWFLPNLATL